MRHHTPRSGLFRRWLTTTTALAGVLPVLALTAPAARANPEGGSVVQGAATITQTNPKTVTVNQTTDKAVINWQSFSIGADETTRFNQPSSSSTTLNRVTGDQVSKILGNLSANGKVFLVNPNGIVFGAGSKIDVAALVASTADIKTENFMAGNLRFDIPGKVGAEIVNQGTITAADGGLVALVSPVLRNSGIIQARLGKVALASANGVTLDLYGDNLILFQAADKITQQMVDTDGNPVTTAIDNSGQIYADGGRVLMTANTAKGVVDNAINTTGLVSARTVEQQGGEIVLKGEGGGNVQVAGTLDASAPNGGDGGFIETSGEKVTISPMARITTNAPVGKTGRWLIDPTDYVIAASGGDITSAQLATYLNATDIEIQTATEGIENGDIYVNQGISWTSANKLTLTAYRHIYVNQLINATGGGSVKLRADNTGQGVGTVAFAGDGRVIANNGAAVGIYYNPNSYTDVATKSDTSSNPYTSFVTLNGGSSLTAYMLVNDLMSLQSIQSNLSGNYALGKDIDATPTSNWNNGLGFQPIGYSLSGQYYEHGQNSFSGKLNGNGNSIRNIYINRPYQTKVGLIGELSGSVWDIALEDGSVTGNEAVGGLVGLNRGNVGNSESSVNIFGMRYMGGLVGANMSAAYGGLFNTQITWIYATINNGRSSGDVTTLTGGVNAGGLVGYNYYGIISDSHATGKVDATAGPGGSSSGGAGGLVGMDEGRVLRSFATGNVSGVDYVGGLIGIGAAGGLENSYATGRVTGRQHVGALIGFNEGSILNSYATGAVSGSVNVGGLGGTDSQPPYYYWTTTNSYWDMNTTGRASSAGGTGKTTSELMQQNTYAGWDFTNVWQINEGTSYPTLRTSPRPNSLTLTPGVTVSQSTIAMFNQYRNADATTLLSGILAGDLRNDPTNAVWHALYQNGHATPVQVEANRLWNLYDDYKEASAELIAAALRSNLFSSESNDPVWKALEGNPNRNAALGLIKTIPPSDTNPIEPPPSEQIPLPNPPGGTNPQPPDPSYHFNLDLVAQMQQASTPMGVFSAINDAFGAFAEDAAKAILGNPINMMQRQEDISNVVVDYIYRYGNNINYKTDTITNAVTQAVDFNPQAKLGQTLGDIAAVSKGISEFMDLSSSARSVFSTFKELPDSLATIVSNVQSVAKDTRKIELMKNLLSNVAKNMDASTATGKSRLDLKIELFSLVKELTEEKLAIDSITSIINMAKTARDISGASDDVEKILDKAVSVIIGQIQIKTMDETVGDANLFKLYTQEATIKAMAKMEGKSISEFAATHPDIEVFAYDGENIFGGSKIKTTTISSLYAIN